MLAIPVRADITSGTWLRADTVAVGLVPVVADSAVFWLAVASAHFRVLGVDSPVLAFWADLNVADALSSSGIPMETGIAFIRRCDTRTGAFVENLAGQ